MGMEKVISCDTIACKKKITAADAFQLFDQENQWVQLTYLPGKIYYFCPECWRSNGRRPATSEDD